ncbi:hypothetical protein [uncultured Streptococcus sp.]|uniref:hypothetical protein n=1 Tax=uncultured Streptococcus sp. TaxID=83427 RepID=UPI002595EC41|nr:hypothetical protein [uncultured Streptococcus sp.]
MDFNAIYKLNEDEQQNANPAPAQGEDDGLPQDVHASEEALNIAMNQLQLIVKSFKEDNYIQQMMDFYDGNTAKKESVEADNNAEHLTEAKKGSFKSYYNQIVKSLSNTQKKIKIAAMILIATAIVAGAGVGTVLIKKLVNGKKALKDAKNTLDNNVLADNANQNLSGSNGANGVSETNGTEAPVENTAEASTDEKGVEPTDPNAQKTPEEKKAELKPADPTVIAAVEAGQYGVNPDRVNSLIKAGYDPTSVQNAVNQDIKSHPEKQATAPQAVETPASEQEVVNKIAKKEAEPGSTAPVTPASLPGKEAEPVAQEPTAQKPATDANNLNVEGSTQPTTTPTATPTGDNGYNSWVNNPANQKFINSIRAQAQAAGQNPDVVLKDIYANGGGKDVNALRTIQNKYGFNDISGSGTTDRKVMKTINASTRLAQVESDPNVQAYLNFLKTSNPKKYGSANSATELANLVSGGNTGLMTYNRNRDGTGGWEYLPGVTQQIKQGKDTLLRAKKGQ